MLKDETTESEKGEPVNEIEANADQGNNTGVVDHEDSEDNANRDSVKDQLIDEEDEYDKEENDEDNESTDKN